MRKIFLDCGAWNGCSTNFFRANHPEGKDFEVFCFDPLPENIESLNKLKDVTVIPKAVWWFPTTMRFYKGLSQSGSCYKEKRTGEVDPNDWIEVDAISLSDFIEGNFKREDYIICKLNIEGAEYKVIHQLHHKGVLSWIDKLYVQWHWDKVGVDKQLHEEIKNLVKWYPWNAMTNKVEEFKSTLND